MSGGIKIDVKEIENRLSPEVKEVLEATKPYLEKARPDDYDHVYDMLQEILDFESDKIKFDLDVLLPVAILHDIGHCRILPEHYKLLTGPEKLKNGKLVHMIVGAQIAKEVLEKINYDKEKAKEIIELVSMHDADKIDGWGDEYFDTENKKIFHDFDRLGAFNVARMEKVVERTPKEKLKKMGDEILKYTNKMFYPEFKEKGLERYEQVKHLWE